jgi:tetratricopeptide (TPR) repeat protein
MGMRRLRRAHSLFERGDYAEAATIFEQLARAAQSRDLPRAPNLYFQAGLAYELTGDRQRGRKNLKTGFLILYERGARSRMRHVGKRILQTLETHSLSEEARALEELLQSQFSIPGEEENTSKPSGSQYELPPKCPYCGGTVHPEEVNWQEQNLAVCDYCGSVIKASG